MRALQEQIKDIYNEFPVHHILTNGILNSLPHLNKNEIQKRFSHCPSKYFMAGCILHYCPIVERKEIHNFATYRGKKIFYIVTFVHLGGVFSPPPNELEG